MAILPLLGGGLLILTGAMAMRSGGESGGASSLEQRLLRTRVEARDSQEEARFIDHWIKKNQLNTYGDPPDTMYLGGTPLFDESTGTSIDKYDLIRSKNPEKPWLFEEYRFPFHWGMRPRMETRDLVPLPGDYGRGSSTLANWIQENLDKDRRGVELEQVRQSRDLK